ncbi:MAG: LptF/LptG family permease [Gemmatimonadota bacterium]|nr:LptF/LptG family permease [Gemmatimonadota bacterium]
MKILRRYVLMEHVGPLVFALAVLTSLLLLNQVAKQFGNLVGKGLAWSVIGEFFLLSIPFIIAMTLPMAVLVSTLYAFSRLAAENEITALKASGVGLLRIIQPVLWGAAAIALFMLAFNDQILPRSNHRLRVLQSDIARKKPTFALKEQVINEVSQGRLFLRAGKIDENTDLLREITIYDLSDPVRRRTIYADSGRMALSESMEDLELTLYHGYSQESSRSNPTELQRLFYVTDLIRVRGVANPFERDTADNYRGEREMSICEMEEEYRQRSREWSAARFELGEMLGNAAHRAATGEIRPLRKAEPKEPRLTIGKLYCTVVRPLGGVPVAEAATPEHSSTASRDWEVENGGTVENLTPQQQTAKPQGRGDSLRRERPAAPELNPDFPPLPREMRTFTQPTDSAGAAVVGRTSSGLRTPLTSRRPQEIVRPRVVAPNPLGVGELEMLRSRVREASERMSQYQVEIQKKFALAAACVVFVLLGAPIALRFPRGGVGLVIGVSLGVFALYYIGLIAGETLADKLIVNAFWSMWLANVLFTMVGIYFIYLVQKSGSTARGGDFSELLDSLRAWFAKGARRIGIPLNRRRTVAS